MTKFLLGCALAAALMTGDLLELGTIASLPRDVWVVVTTSGGHRHEGLLLDADDRRVVLVSEVKIYIDQGCIESVSIEK